MYWLHGLTLAQVDFWLNIASLVVQNYSLKHHSSIRADQSNVGAEGTILIPSSFKHPSISHVRPLQSHCLQRPINVSQTALCFPCVSVFVRAKVFHPHRNPL